MDPIGLFLKDLMVEKNVVTSNLIIAFDNASPELPLKSLFGNNGYRTTSEENWHFQLGQFSTLSSDGSVSTDSRSSRWDSIPNLRSDSINSNDKAKREGIPSLPRRTPEKEGVMQELLTMAERFE